MIRVRVPGSSANLGPGFDAFAAALALHLELEVRGDRLVRVRDRPARRARPAQPRGPRVRTPAPAGPLRVPDALVDPALRRAGLERRGLRRRPARRRPRPRRRLGPPRTRDRDGGPPGQRRGVAARRRRPSTSTAAPRASSRRPGSRAILVVPRAPVRTAAARAALPATVPLADAAANAGHAALLALGLERGDLDLVAAGLRDRIHQPYRAHLYPQSAALLERAPALGALGATISGAGPTVLVWARTEAAADVTRGARARGRRLGDACCPRRSSRAAPRCSRARGRPSRSARSRSRPWPSRSPT